MLLIVCLIGAYLLGAIPFSFIVARRVKGIDLRRHGSGNLGATNIVRTLGVRWGLLVLLLDMGKGALAVLLMSGVVASWPSGEPTPLHLPPDVWRILAGGLAAFGHTFSPFVDFHGGKGVATSGGAFFILAPYATLAALGVFLLVFAFSRIVSLASLAAAGAMPIAVAYFEWQSAHFSRTIFVFTLIICAWIILRHRTNISRLQAGTERPLEAANGEQKKESP
jgi:glycerol-3-phosphate acyltransferase PlsY